MSYVPPELRPAMIALMAHGINPHLQYAGGGIYVLELNLDDNGDRYLWLSDGDPSGWTLARYSSDEKDPDYEGTYLTTCEPDLNVVAAKIKEALR